MDENSLSQIDKKDLKRLTLFIELLETLSQSTDYQILASENFNIKPDDAENERMRKILEFTLDNFQNEVEINAVEIPIGNSYKENWLAYLATSK